MSRRATLLLVIFLLGASRASVALTILDVIQLSQRNYTDAQIIEIIEATDAVFELEAADLPRLKQLGVSEAVIRVMLRRRPPASTQTSSESSDAARSAAPTAPDRPPVTPAPPPSLADVAQRANRPRQPARSVTATPPSSAVRPSRAAAVPSGLSTGTAPRLTAVALVAEDRAGGHAHVALVLRGLEVFVLRDEPHTARSPIGPPHWPRNSKPHTRKVMGRSGTRASEARTPSSFGNPATTIRGSSRG